MVTWINLELNVKKIKNLKFVALLLLHDQMRLKRFKEQRFSEKNIHWVSPFQLILIFLSVYMCFEEFSKKKLAKIWKNSTATATIKMKIEWICITIHLKLQKSYNDKLGTLQQQLIIHHRFKIFSTFKITNSFNIAYFKNLT